MSGIASVGVIVASAALLIVLSVFQGLREFTLEFSNFTDPDLKLIPSSGKSFLLTENDVEAISKIHAISSYSKTIEERVVIKVEDKEQIATLKGVDSVYNSVTQIETMINRGKWLTQGSNELVSGMGISNTLSFGTFNVLKPLTIYVPKPGKGQISSVRSLFNSKLAMNVGLFSVNENLDNEYIFSDLTFARELLGYEPQQISTLEFRLVNGADEKEVRETLEKEFPDKLILNRAQLNDALYKMLNTENLAVYLIFTLVIIIALFNVIGAIIMMILDKKKSLSTLFNLGTDTKAIKAIFFYQGSLMTILSTLIGIVIAVLVVWSQLAFGWFKLTPNFAYPIALNPLNILVVMVTIFTLGIVASKIASQRITKLLLTA